MNHWEMGFGARQKLLHDKFLCSTPETKSASVSRLVTQSSLFHDPQDSSYTDSVFCEIKKLFFILI